MQRLCFFAVLLFACFAFSCSSQKSNHDPIVVEDVRTIIGERDELRTALDSCLADIEKKCKGVINYALALEKENAALHSYVRELEKNE